MPTFIHRFCLSRLWTSLVPFQFHGHYGALKKLMFQYSYSPVEFFRFDCAEIIPFNDILHILPVLLRAHGLVWVLLVKNWNFLKDCQLCNIHCLPQTTDMVIVRCAYCKLLQLMDYSTAKLLDRAFQFLKNIVVHSNFEVQLHELPFTVLLKCTIDFRKRDKLFALTWFP